MLEIIALFQSIIADFTSATDESDDVFVTKIRIKFVNHTKLSVFELDDYLTKNRKYGYQWMNEDNSLIIRWDNAPHHTYIPTFPFHQHIETDENVHPSEEMTLAKVFDFISKNLA